MVLGGISREWIILLEDILNFATRQSFKAMNLRYLFPATPIRVCFYLSPFILVNLDDINHFCNVDECLNLFCTSSLTISKAWR